MTISINFNFEILEVFFFYMIGWPISSDFYIFTQSLTYQFIHSGFLHLFMNMLSLVYFGTQVEKKIGSKKLLFFYLISGIISEYVHFQYSQSPIVGASGSIWGILILYWFYYKEDIVDLFFIKVKVNKMFTVLIISEILSTVMVTESNISHLAHLGGAFSGLCLYYLNKLFVGK